MSVSCLVSTSCSLTETGSVTSMQVRNGDQELRFIANELMKEQFKQEKQVDAATDELRRWKGLAVKHRLELTNLQSQLSLHQTTLKQSRNDTRSMRDEVEALQHELERVEKELKSSKECAHSLHEGLRELEDKAATTKAIAVHRSQRKDRLTGLLESKLR